METSPTSTIQTSTLISLYSRILASLDLHADDKGFISSGTGPTAMPATIGDKRLVLPTPDVLCTLSDRQIAFHPLGESAARGESPVLSWLRLMINQKLSLMIGVLVLDLLRLANDKTSHERMSPDQREILKILEDVNDQTITSLCDIVNAMDAEGEYRFVNLFLKRKGQLNGKQYYRTAIVTFPILDYADEKDLVIFNVKLKNQKDKRTILALFSYVLGQFAQKVDYSHGSLSGTAPFFHALINAYAKLGLWLNDMLYEYRDFIAGVSTVWINDMDWVDGVTTIDCYRGLLPPLPGNEGVHLEGSRTDVPVMATNNSQPTTTGFVSPLSQPANSDTAGVPTTTSDRLKRSGFNVGAKREVFVTDPNPALGDAPRRGFKEDEVMSLTRATAQLEQEELQKAMLLNRRGFGNGGGGFGNNGGWNQPSVNRDPYARAGSSNNTNNGFASNNNGFGNNGFGNGGFGGNRGNLSF